MSKGEEKEKDVWCTQRVIKTGAAVIRKHFQRQKGSESLLRGEESLLPARISSPTACTCHVASASNYSVADIFGTELEGSVTMQREPV